MGALTQAVESADVVIGGAGIIGLSAALELAVHGLRVTVLEQGVAMREASWAAAGMLAAHDPENPPELRALADLSLGLYPQFLAEVERLSRLRVPLRTAGTLQGFHCAVEAGEAGGSLGAEELRRLVPELRMGARSFAWLEEQSLDPRDLCAALPVAVRAAGVSLREHTRVRAVKDLGDRVWIETEDGVALAARHYVHCCGAWSGMAEELGVAVEPRKGQMVTVALPEHGPGLEYVLRTPELYLVPRDALGGNGGPPRRRVAIGATVERAGFDRTLSSAAADGLMEAAGELWPPIRSGVITEHWSGLRPWAADDLPVIGPVGGCFGDRVEQGGERLSSAGCWVATGHYRNGILLAPGTARVLRESITGKMASVALDAFRPSRFAGVLPLR